MLVKRLASPIPPLAEGGLKLSAPLLCFQGLLAQAATTMATEIVVTWFVVGVTKHEPRVTNHEAGDPQGHGCQGLRPGLSGF